VGAALVATCTAIPVAPIAAGGYPRAIQTVAGERLLCTCGAGELAVWASLESSSAKWVRRGTVVEDTRSGVDLANCVVFEPEPGHLLAAYRYHTGCNDAPGGERLVGTALQQARCTNFSLQVSASTNRGRSWAYLSTVVHGAVGMWEPFFFETAAGLRLAYSQELTNGGLQSIVWQLSTDRGATWHPSITISNGTEHHSRDGMPGLARLGGNAVALVFEGFWAHGPGHFSVQLRQSSDDGTTWDAGRVIYAPALPSANAGAPQVAVVGKSVFVSFMCDEDVPTDNRTWPTDAATKIMSAVNTGGALNFQSGINRRTVGEWPGALWPGLAVFESDQQTDFGGAIQAVDSAAAYVLFGRHAESYLCGPLAP